VKKTRRGQEEGKKNREKGKRSHDVVGGPEDAVAMEGPGGIEPERVPLLPPSARAPVPVHVRLESPFLALNVPQELYVQLVVGLLEYVTIRRLRHVFHVMYEK